MSRPDGRQDRSIVLPIRVHICLAWHSIHCSSKTMAESLSSGLSDPPSTSPSPPNGLMASSPPADEPPSPTPRPTVLLRSEEEYTQEQQQHCDCCGRRRRSETEKLDYIFTLLRTWRWTFTKLLDLFSMRRKELKYQKHWSNFESYMRNPKSTVNS